MRSVIHIIKNGVNNMENEKKLILDKEINGCKVKVFCAAEKKKSAKETVLFYLCDSFERNSVANAFEKTSS